MVNVFDTWVIKPWKSSPKAPVDSLPLEVFKSGLNAFLAALLPFKEGFIQGSVLAGAKQQGRWWQRFLTSPLHPMSQGCCRGCTHLPLPVA